MGGVTYGSTASRPGMTHWANEASPLNSVPSSMRFAPEARSPVSARAGFEALRTALAALESIDTGAVVDLTTWGAA